ncbi:MAG: DNA-binding protein [Sphingobacteriia bacterium 35-40-8]|jgi:excisionase family DNA binding protein|nr:MAG: DNA-binding protein [Sphingobacteriia bacterium 35-40-8]HQR92215.1 helix-turn-helix domain-containing protein [Sediminibacterium sp.]
MTEIIEQKLRAIEDLLRQQNMMKKEVLSLGEACEYLSVSASYLYKLTCTNQIPHYVPTGKKIYFKRSEIDEWLLRNRQTTDAELEQQAAEYVTYNKRGGSR